MHLYKDRFFVDFLEDIWFNHIFITQSINAQCSWCWTSFQISSLILIVLRNYFTILKGIFMVFELLRRKPGGKVLYKYMKRIFTTMISHDNSNESNNWFNYHIYHTINQCLRLMTLNVFSNFKFDFYFNEALFYRIKINSYGV